MEITNDFYLKHNVSNLYFSGDTGFDAVTQWDDNIFRDDDNVQRDEFVKPGPVFLKLARLLFDDAMSGNTPDHEKIQ